LPATSYLAGTEINLNVRHVGNFGSRVTDLMTTARRRSLLDLPSLNVDADIAVSMARIVEASGLSRAEAVDRLNETARRFGVRLCGGSAEALTLATLEKWLNPNEPKNVPSLRALNIFCHVFQAPAPLDLLARSHGLGWRVIDGEDAKLLEWARTEREIRNLRAKKRRLESGL